MGYLLVPVEKVPELLSQIPTQNSLLGPKLTV